MNVSIVLAHPNPHSFNHAIAQAACQQLEQNGHTVAFHDLHAEGFVPLLPAEEFSKEATLSEEIEAHCREVASADGIIIVHPNWWGMPPAILKGWIDRVLRPGVAYEFLAGDSGEGVPRGLLKARAALVFNTANTSAAREENVFGDPLERIWKDCIFGLCGVSRVYRQMFRIVVTSSPAQRQAWLAETKNITGRYFPPNG
ncbi:MAG: NAD(P)H-dependent oxidoreductase [Chloroflexota bacterium]